ncbi:MAG: RHS domain-containing protein [Acidobacteria bacterium]|nr:RHS domain-containing protein [Acidobacteriota bacterium]
MQTGNDVRYFIADHLGSTNALTDSSGNVTSSASYDSFGNATGNLATRYKFTGREYDDFTGLHYYRARWYDGNLGRFISEDPIGFAGGDVNLYGYVGNGPVELVDPSGLYVEARFSRSLGVMQVTEWRGGLGIIDWFFGPLREESYSVFSGCRCQETPNQWDVGGPIPNGIYLIDKERDVNGDAPWKRVSHRLLASQSGSIEGPFDYSLGVTNPATGGITRRDNFYIHPGSVSLGCVTFQKESNLEDGAPWSRDYESFDRLLRDTSPYYFRGRRGTGVFGGTLIVTE